MRIRSCRARGVLASLLAVGLVGASVCVGASASAAVPGPRKEEWWFTAWDIQNQVWPITRGRGETVAVLGNGVEASLPELHGVVQPGFDARVGFDDDGRKPVKSCSGLLDCPITGGRHATGMAGLIASQGGPHHYLGVAPDAKIMPVVVGGHPADVGAAIAGAADRGAQVIDASLGSAYPGGCPGDAQAGVLHAIDRGAVVVAAMGDEGAASNDTLFPASCAGVLAVGAVNNHKLAWTRTERQPYVSAGAPGIDIGELTPSGGFDPTIDGTSGAAALAAGAVALVRSKFPQLSPRQVVQLIVNTTVDAGPPGDDDMTGKGVIVPIRALTMHVDPNAPNPTFTRLDQWQRENRALATMWDSPTPTPTRTAVAIPSATSSPRLASGRVLYGTAAVLGLLFLAVVAVIVVAVVSTSRRTARRTAPQSSYPGRPHMYAPPQGAHEQPPGSAPPSYHRPDQPPPPHKW